VIETICACRDDPGESVQLQVIKALLTAVSSNTCEVHGESLLLSVRACYHIYLVSRNQVNRTTAKATLTQMLNIVFQRMEVFDQKLAAEAGSDSIVSEVSPSASPDVASMPMPAPLLEDSAVLAAVSPDGAAPEAVTVAAESTEGDADGGAREEAASDAAAAATAVAGEVAAGGTATPAAAPVDPAAEEGEGYGGTPASSGFRSPIHRDAFLLFRALCKLSMKGEGDSDDSGVSSPTVGAMADTIALQSKVLSLELLLSVLEHSGPSFRSGSRFIDVIRQMLCESLLKNYVSPSAQVVSLSLKIFLALIRNFRVYLQREIEVFIAEVFLRLLHSAHVPYDQRVRIVFETGVFC
jgi:brefeldin A-inhibited guanine nucleotide-exchange protein